LSECWDFVEVGWIPFGFSCEPHQEWIHLLWPESLPLFVAANSCSVSLSSVVCSSEDMVLGEAAALIQTLSESLQLQTKRRSRTAGFVSSLHQRP
jgi:hypothetical protein